MTKETGTLAELNLKPGDVVAHVDAYGARSKPMKVNRCPPMDDTAFPDHWDVGDGYYTDEPVWRIISRASQTDPETPKLWRDMTPEEKGALLLAEYEDKQLQVHLEGVWTDFYNDRSELYRDDLAYRIRPEPKRMTVDLMADFKVIGTIDLLDGKPDFTSIKPLD